MNGTQYDAAGRVTARTLGSGLVQQYAYYPWTEQSGRLQQVSTGTLQNLSYSYDPAGNITQIVDTAGGETQQYGYDALNRLSSWRLNGSLSGLYAYDPFSGSLEAKGMLELDYGDPAHPHAVSAAQAVRGATSEPGNPGTAGLAGWWSMDEAGGARSDSQGGSDLDEHSGVPAVPGQQARAARFVPAGGGHLEAADSPELSLGDVDFTWLAQVYLESTPNTMLIAIKGERSVPSQREFNLAYNLEAGGRFVFRVGNGSTTATVQSDVVQAGRWYTLAAWHDSQNNTLNLQVDNGTVYSTSYSGGSYDSSLPLSIGASSDGLNVLSGRVDELALYKRVLTADERAWLYNSGQGRSYGELVPGLSFTCPQGETCDQDQAAGQVVDNSYGYDANGNQTSRIINGVTFILSYDADGHLVSVSGPSLSASFVYDGDGKRVTSTINGETTYFVGNYYEVSGSTITKYYYAGSQRVAMKTGSTVHYLLADHLGSTNLTMNASGNVVSELRYTAWGSARYQAGTTPTEYTFTGQYGYDFGLMYFSARWLDVSISHFAQADTVIPGAGNPQAWDRYAYANNAPARFIDPSGHRPDDGCITQGCHLTSYQRDQDTQKSAILAAQANAHSCAAGNRAYCSGWDNWAWGNLPSAIGTHQGLTLLIGAGFEFSVSAELSTVFNWRSGQITSLFNYATGGYEGTPHGISLIKNGGITSVRGASDNKYLEGQAAFTGASASADAVGIVGISSQRSQAIDSSGQQFIDPQSKMPIDIGQASAVIGVNLTPNYVDVGVTAGEANSFILREINVYEWFR